MPKVTILMSVHLVDSPLALVWLKESVNSVLSQTFDSFEFLIGTDGNVGYLKGYLSNIQDSRVSIHRFPKQGQTKIYNAMLKLANGNYITKIDSDDYYDKSILDKQFSYLEENKDVVACGVWRRLILPTGRFSSHIVKGDVNRVKEFKDLAGVLSGSGTMIRTNAVKDVGGWGINDTEYIPYAQDFALWVKLKKLNYNFDIIKEVLYFYREHEFQVSSMHRQEQLKCHQLVVERLCQD